MKTIFRLLVFVLLVAGWGLAALSVHVVRTPEQVPVTLVTKEASASATRTWIRPSGRSTT